MSLEIEIKSNSKQAEDSLKRLLKTIDQLPTSVQNSTKEFSGFSKDVSKDLKTINKNVEQSGKAVERTVKSLSNFAKITGGLITGLLAAGGISSLSSQFTELNNRIALTTGRTQQLVVQQQKLFAISRRSNVDLQTTVSLYSSLVVNAQRTRKEATTLTEVLIKAGKIGGGPAETIASSLVQLQQGLASGTLRGEELNSVLEGTPRIAQAIAKELKTSTGQLRAMAAEGKISGDTVASALINAKDDIEREFALLEIPFNQIIANSGRDIGVALSRVFKSVNDVLTATFGDGDIVGSLTNGIVEGLSDLSVFFRKIQTDIVLFKLEFGSLESIITSSWRGMVDGVVSYAGKFMDAVNVVKDFAKSIGSIFYDLYIEVVGNSTWPDLVDGVISYSDMFNKAYDKVASFAKRVGATFKELAIAVKNGLVAPALGGLDSMISSLKSNVKRFINQVSAFAVEGITTALGVALTGAFAIAVLGGGLAGTLGAKIATAFIGAVGAYFLGFAGNFEAGEAGDNGVLNQIAMNTENVALTIHDGIGQLMGALASGSSAIGGSSAVTGIDVLTPVLRLFSENVSGFVLAIPLLIGAVKAFGGVGSALMGLLQGSAIRAVGSAAGDAGQVAASRGQVSRLRATEDRLKADIESIGATFKGGAVELEAEKDRLTEALRQTSESVKRQETVLSKARDRRNERRDSVIRGAGNLGGAAGGILGGFAGAALGTEIGRSFGLTSGQTLIATLLGSQLVGALGAGIAQFFVQRATSMLFLASGAIKASLIAGGTALAGIMKTVFVIGGAVLRASIVMASTLGGALFRGALIAGSVIGAALSRAAIIAGSVIAAGIMTAVAFIIANAIPIAIGLAVAGLLAVIYIFSDKIIEGGQWLLDKIIEGFDVMKEKGKEFADSVMDGFGKIKDLGKDMASSFLEKLKGLNPFSGGDESPVKRASGGSVFGAGSATSDSIPAMLSNGEFVVKTSVADKHRGFLQSLNSTGELPKFATGGTAGGEPSIMSKIGDAGSGIMDTIMEFMEKIFGKDLMSTMGEIFANLKKSLGFGGGKKDKDAGKVMSATDLATAVATALPVIEFSTEELTQAFDANARLTERVLSLNEQRNKVQQAIADLTVKGQAIPLQLSNQLRLIDSDIITETGKVANILEDIKDDGKLQIKAIDALATQAANDFKGDVQGGIAGLLKGELNFKDFGEGLLLDFSTGILDTLGGGITEGLFKNEDGEASALGGGIEDLFNAMGMKGFSLGSDGGDKLQDIGSELLGKTEGTPMYVRVVNALGMGGGEGGMPSALDGLTEGADATLPGLEDGGETGDPTKAATGLGKFTEMLQEGAAGLGGWVTQTLMNIAQFFGLSIATTAQTSVATAQTLTAGAFTAAMGVATGAAAILAAALTAAAAASVIPGFSTGGAVSGRGTGTSDSIMARLSNGEYVINAAQTKKHRGLIEAINSGKDLPGYATGGMVETGASGQAVMADVASRPQSNSTQTVQNINITGDISRQTKKEIFGMLPQIAVGVNQQNREQNR